MWHLRGVNWWCVCVRACVRACVIHLAHPVRIFLYVNCVLVTEVMCCVTDVHVTVPLSVHWSVQHDVCVFLLRCTLEYVDRRRTHGVCRGHDNFCRTVPHSFSHLKVPWFLFNQLPPAWLCLVNHISITGKCVSTATCQIMKFVFIEGLHKSIGVICTCQPRISHTCTYMGVWIHMEVLHYWTGVMKQFIYVRTYVYVRDIYTVESPYCDIEAVIKMLTFCIRMPVWWLWLWALSTYVHGHATGTGTHAYMGVGHFVPTGVGAEWQSPFGKNSQDVGRLWNGSRYVGGGNQHFAWEWPDKGW